MSHRLIVSRYKENVGWAEVFGNYTIYNKGRDDLPSYMKPNSVRIGNVGRESHSYIYHIIENYDCLEDIIVFSQGDYMSHMGLAPDEFFDISMDMGDQGFSVKLLERRPVSGTNQRNFVLRWHGEDLHTKNPYDLGGWWEQTTGEAYIRSRSVFWGGIFAVRKECILRRSRESYMDILKTIDWCSNPMEGHFCERSWFNILNLPLDFASTNLDHRSLPYIEHIDASFGTEKLLERWASCEGSKEGRRVSIKFRKSLPDISIDPLISRSELAGSLEHLRDLMLKDEVTVKRCTDALRYNIERWARINCPSYPIDKEYVEKSDLENKEGWYVANLMNNSTEVGTTGSTSGFPFRYMRWLGTFDKIEWDYHYNFVLDEFGVRQNPNILYFFSDHFKSEGSNPIYCTGEPSELHLNNHGTGRSPITHYVNFPIYQKDQESFFRHMFDYVREHEIDVLFTSPPQISSMCNYIRKLGVNHKIGKLLSSTGDRILPSDAKFLFLDNGYFDDACDHMRCWDGGATFYTCKHRNYHLMDNLAWVEEVDGRMICTDYFNLASPFVRYWNGDYCKIGKEYRRCECGRLYREFEFMQSRPFSLKGVCMKEIKDGLKVLGIPGIKEVRCSQSHLDVVSVVPISQEDRLKIASLSDKFPFRFLTEEFHS